MISLCFFLVVVAVGVLVGGFEALRQVRLAQEGAAISGGLQGAVRTAWEVSQTFTDPPGTLAFQGRERMNILCLGIDYNYTRNGILYTKNARSDTLFVLSIDSQARTMSILSIPRDTRVYVPAAGGYDKINAAYSYGEVEEARRTVSEFLGIPIHHYVLVKVKGAGELVEAVGGLEVDVEKDMDYDDTWGNLHIHLKQGRQVLDGQQAVGYCRFRMDEEGDRGRIRRQQQVMHALMERLASPSIVPRLKGIVETVRANTETDLSLAEMLDLANLYHGFNRSHLHTGTVDGYDVDIGGLSYIIPFDEPTRQLVRELLEPEAAPASLEIAEPSPSPTGTLPTPLMVPRAEGPAPARVETLEVLPPVTGS